MVYSGVAAIIQTAVLAITTTITGQSFDFFTTENTQKNRSGISRHHLWFGLRVGSRVLARINPGRYSKYAARQRLAIAWHNACSSMSRRSSYTTQEITTKN